jgi:protein-tyrosine phosphatase
MAPMKTSQKDPIRVDFVDGKRAGIEIDGRIGLTIAPGKKDQHRGWDRDLDIDLARLIGEYGGHVLASLMESHEYELLQIPDLRARASAVGFDVRWFPIVDVQAPEPARMREFAMYINGLVDAVNAGKTVVIHCRGGLGRSGTVAACCLVRLGLTPKKAIEVTRAGRPDAIEMPSQEAWVEQYAKHFAETREQPP